MVCAVAAGNDTYVSYDANGTPRFASQPYDASYTLYLKGDNEPVSMPTKPPTRTAMVRTAAARTALYPVVRKAALDHDLDPALITAVIDVESGFNPQARSSKGAIGPMQLLPATAARYGFTNPWDPAQNVEAGARHLKGLLIRFGGNLALALAAYNAGEGAVTRNRQGIPPYRETMLYVPAVLARYRMYQQASAASQ